MLTILQAPNKILRQIADPVTEFDAKLQRLASDMIETLKHHSGWGLAAPQVGVSLRLIVTMPKGHEPEVWVNPEITSTFGTDGAQEGCLSVGRGEVRYFKRRAKSIKLRYQTVLGEVCEKAAKGNLARVIQHEIGHLEGKLVSD